MLIPSPSSSPIYRLLHCLQIQSKNAPFLWCKHLWSLAISIHALLILMKMSQCWVRCLRCYFSPLRSWGRRPDHLVLKLTGTKTKIHSTLDQQLATTMDVQVNGNLVKFVDSFTYLVSTVHRTVSSEPQIRRRILIARECMKAIVLRTYGVWASLWMPNCVFTMCISLPSCYMERKCGLVTLAMQKKLNAFDLVMQCIAIVHRCIYAYRSTFSQHTPRQAMRRPRVTTNTTDNRCSATSYPASQYFYIAISIQCAKCKVLYAPLSQPIGWNFLRCV